MAALSGAVSAGFQGMGCFAQHLILKFEQQSSVKGYIQSLRFSPLYHHENY